MEVNFVILGRLGNAIYRYMASTLVCILYNGNYVINKKQSANLTDTDFYNIFISKSHNSTEENDKNNKQTSSSVNMNGYYQHDSIYNYHKESIIDFIKNNPSHYVLTDGVSAGDLNSEQFFMIDILLTPTNFSKRFKYVLHLRLEDFVTHNLYIYKERIVDLLKQINIDDDICIVCNKPKTEFEFSYINYIQDFLKQQNINTIFESNDVLTDYYIMKEAEILICSKSTLSWCAAFSQIKSKHVIFLIIT